jgi:Predicted membrane protein (DUF2079)
MSDAVVGAPAVTVPPKERTEAKSAVDLRLVTRVAWGAFAIQLGVLMAWSAMLASHDALTKDFTTYHQAWYLIAHGNFNPFDTAQGVSFFKIDSEFVMVPLAALYWVWPHLVTLLWVQDLAIAGSGLVAWYWLRDLMVRPIAAQGLRADLALWLALALFVFNPWAYWSTSFDFHLEPLIGLLLVLTARAMYRGKKWQVAFFVVCTLICGVPAATYLLGLGIGGLIMAKGRRWMAAGIVGASVALVLGAITFGGSLANSGSNANLLYSNLVGHRVTGHLAAGKIIKAIIEHPIALIGLWWRQVADAWAMVSPSGGIGILYGWAVGIVALGLGSTDLFEGGSRFWASLAYQQFPVFIFTVVGTVCLLNWLGRKVNQRLALALGGVLLAFSVGWAASWLPTMPGTWLRVSPGAAVTLDKAEQLIPKTDEVVVSQGVAGGFSSRKLIYQIPGLPIYVPIQTRPVYFVIAPYDGIELASVAASEGALTQLAQIGAEPVLHGGRVWVMRWDPPKGVRALDLSGQRSTEAAYGLVSTTGVPITSGPPTQWHLAARSDAPGYVEHGAYFRENPGHYEAGVALSSSGPVIVDVWNTSGNVLLARRQVPATNGLYEVLIPFQVTHEYPPYLYTGVGPFRLYRAPPPNKNAIEVRVWSRGGAEVNVYTVSMMHQR